MYSDRRMHEFRQSDLAAFYAREDWREYRRSVWSAVSNVLTGLAVLAVVYAFWWME